jgi:hypothetical protein
MIFSKNKKQFVVLVFETKVIVPTHLCVLRHYRYNIVACHPVPFRKRKNGDENLTRLYNPSHNLAFITCGKLSRSNPDFAIGAGAAADARPGARRAACFLGGTRTRAVSSIGRAGSPLERSEKRESRGRTEAYLPIAVVVRDRGRRGPALR